MTFAHWVHHLFNPHCVECREEKQESKVCQSCETLKMQLAIANAEKSQMLAALIVKPEPEVIKHNTKEIMEEIKPRTMTWNVRRQMLEAEDRAKAQLEKNRIEAEKSLRNKINDLEKELDLNAETVQRNDGKVIQSEGNEVEQAGKEVIASIENFFQAK